MGFKELLKGFAQSLVEEEVEVGVVKKELITQIQLIEDEHDAQHDEAIAKISEYAEGIMGEANAKIEAFKEEVEKEHEPDCKRAKESLKAVWKQIYADNGLPQDEETEYRIEKNTGKLTKVVIPEEFRENFKNEKAEWL